MSLQQQFLRHFRLILAVFASALFLAACGGKGSSAPAPSSGITATAGDTQVTINWTPSAGVEYWLFYAPGNSLSSATLSKVSGAVSLINVSPPYVVGGLANDTGYTFVVNGRVDGGAGGPDSTAQATPRLAGTSWNTATPFGGIDMHGLVYGSTTSNTTPTLVAVGSGGVLYSSTDATTTISTNTGAGTWTRINIINTDAANPANPAGNTLNAIGNVLNKYIAVGDNGTIIYTSELSGWAASPTIGTPTKVTAKLNAIASNGTYAVVAGNNGTLLYTTDALTWTPATLPTTDSTGASLNLSGVNFYSVVYTSSGAWFVLGANGTLLNSADGITWTAFASNTVKDLKSLGYIATYNGTTTTYQYVIVGSAGTVLTSTDGVNWSAKTIASDDLIAVVGSNQFLAVSAQGTAYTSLDGGSWTRQATNTTTPLYTLVKAANVYLAVGQGGSLLSSK